VAAVESSPDAAAVARLTDGEVWVQHVVLRHEAAHP
jgi:hypothetical protein